MKTSRKNLEKSIVELIVEANVEEVSKYRKKALKKISEEKEIKGFRKWSDIPENVIISQFWEWALNETIVELAVDEMYRKALLEYKIMPVSQWEIKEIVSQDPLKIKIHVEILPEVKIDEKKLQKIKLKKAEIIVSDEEVNSSIKEIEDRFTRFEETEDKAKKWDKVEIDTDGYDLENNLLESTSMRSYPLVIGSGILIKGFEDELVWCWAWDEKEFDIVFPKDYHNKDFASKKVKFKVKISSVQSAIKPEINEDFIEKIRWKKLSFDWFKELIKKEIYETKESNQNIDNENKLVDKLIEISEIDLWDKLIFEKQKSIFKDIKENMWNQWIKMKDYLGSLKMDEETYKKNHIKEDAIKKIKWELILLELTKILKIKVSDEEVLEKVNKIKENYSSEEVLKRLDDMYKPWTKNFEGLKVSTLIQKVINSFFE